MEFVNENLTGARFIGCEMADVVIRGAWLEGMEIDCPNLERGPLWVNGVDVTPYVAAELVHRFPGRELKRAPTAEGLRRAWAAAEDAWLPVVEDSHGFEDVSIDGEWSFSQTLRHLVFAIDVWLLSAIGDRPKAEVVHPIGQPYAEYGADGGDLSGLREPASYDEVLEVRATHQAAVRDFLAGATDVLLDEERTHPWAPDERTTVRHCLHVILNEEWEHLRYAVRDLAKARKAF